MAEQAHYPIQVGHIVSEEYKGQYIVCACQADQWGEGPAIPVKEYPAHLFASIDPDGLARVIGSVDKRETETYGQYDRRRARAVRNYLTGDESDE